MNTRLAWSQIREVFAGEWIELTSYDWDWGSPRPRWGIVRHSALDRHSLMKLIESSGSSSDALILYVGSAASTVEHASTAAHL